MHGMALIGMLLVGTLPALLPGWRAFLAALAGVAVLYGVQVAWFFWAVEREATEGPAVLAGIAILGVEQVLVIASIIGRLIAHFLARSLGRRARAGLLWGLAVLAASICAFSLSGYASTLLMGAAVPFAWLWLALLLAPRPARPLSPEGARQTSGPLGG
ncbi:MFS family permease [Pseudomonas alcaligenes]|nr:MFS family permease [Pseudomonas alcaligenes]